MPKVSFMTVALNEGNCINALLDDLNRQDYPHADIEVVLVDSLSSDNTKEAMLKFAESSDFCACKVLDNKGKIQACGWNTAIKAAEGDILIRMDAHGRFDPDFISNVVEQMEKGENIVGGQRITVFENKRPMAKLIAHAEASSFGSAVASYRRKVKRSYVKTLAHAAYRKEVFDKVGLFNENLVRTEDNELHYRMSQAGFKFCQCPEIFSYLHARSTLKGMVKQKWGNGFWVGATLPVCPACLSLYNFVPAVFFLVFASAVMWAIQYSSLFSLIFLGIIYLIPSLIASFKEMAREESLLVKPLLLLLPIIFLLMHLFYGAGTVVGLAFSPLLIMKNKEDKK